MASPWANEFDWELASPCIAGQPCKIKISLPSARLSSDASEQADAELSVATADGFVSTGTLEEHTPSTWLYSATLTRAGEASVQVTHPQVGKRVRHKKALHCEPGPVWLEQSDVAGGRAHMWQRLYIDILPRDGWGNVVDAQAAVEQLSHRCSFLPALAFVLVFGVAEGHVRIDFQPAVLKLEADTESRKVVEEEFGDCKQASIARMLMYCLQQHDGETPEGANSKGQIDFSEFKNLVARAKQDSVRQELAQMDMPSHKRLAEALADSYNGLLQHDSMARASTLRHSIESEVEQLLKKDHAAEVIQRTYRDHRARRTTDSEASEPASPLAPLPSCTAVVN